jgi:transketolase
MQPSISYATPVPPPDDRLSHRRESPLPTRLARTGQLADRSRAAVLEMIYRAGSGHVGSSLSCVDIISVLRFDQMNWSATRPRSESDVFILSKGHAAPAWYASLMVGGDLGPEEVGTLRQLDSRLQGHPDRTRLDLVDLSTGALGQGLSVAVGRAQAKRLRGRGDFVYCLAGDGELQEGQIWEAVTVAGARRLANVVLVVDHNGSQNDGLLSEIMPLAGLAERFRAFEWHVQDVNGHSHLSLMDALANARDNQAQPSVVIARTRKGHLGPGRIALNGSHSATLTTEEYESAMRYLEGRRDESHP